MAMSKSNDKRTPNWSRQEIFALLDGVQKEEIQVVRNSRKEAWGRIAGIVNSCGITVRTTEQVEKKWGYLKSRAITTHGKLKRERGKTGSVLQPNVIIAYQLKIV